MTLRSTARLESSSPLLKLPAELRNVIYRIILVQRSRSDGAPMLHVSKATLRSSTRLLRVCRQIRAEATGIFYAENTFCIQSLAATKWLESISDKAALIRELVLKLEPPFLDKLYLPNMQSALRSRYLYSIRRDKLAQRSRQAVRDAKTLYKCLESVIRRGGLEPSVVEICKVDPINELDRIWQGRIHDFMSLLLWQPK